ncbi:MAG: hypothetical protein HPY30_05105 [Gammaproteobacteria bacterium (ex Lamellibrachia satsuma)]|nr:MAG: hypothetical protein HPY30_05105 [Gammaproteobacteria bacterium (ex Lamellibrachia satsuma)]
MERRNAQERRSYGENTFANHNQATKAPTAWNAAGVFLFCEACKLLNIHLRTICAKENNIPADNRGNWYPQTLYQSKQQNSLG